MIPGFDARGGLTRLPAVVERLISGFNTLWKKQHKTDGSHGDITADSLTTSGNIHAGGGLSSVGDFGTGGSGTITTGLAVGGIIAANGGTVRFPATQIPSAGANDLDDYEEGAYTPANSNVAFTTAQGNYTKVGRLVHVAITVQFPATADVNQADCTLPFVLGAAANLAGGFPWNSSVAGVVLATSAGSSNIAVFLTPGGGGVTNVTMSTAVFRIAFTYETDT